MIRRGKKNTNVHTLGQVTPTLSTSTVEPPYNEVIGTMEITLLYQISRYQGKKQGNIKSWDHQNDLAIRGFCYIRPLYNEVPLYIALTTYQGNFLGPKDLIITRFHCTCILYM